MTLYDVLDWATDVDVRGAVHPHDKRTAERIALALAVLEIMERRAATNDGSWVNAEVRNVWPEILAEAKERVK